MSEKTKSKKVITIQKLPSYNKFLSDPFRFQEEDKFIVLGKKEFYYELFSIRLKRKFVLLKNYFRAEKVIVQKQKIQYDE